MILDKIDDWLVNSVHQSIVDWSQRDGAWWIQQISIAVLVFDAICGLSKIMGMGLDARSYFSLCLQLACAAFFVNWSRDKVRVASIGAANGFRKFFIVILPLIIFMDVTKYPLNIPVDLVFMSIYFFAACRPPKPRERKFSKLALNN